MTNKDQRQLPPPWQPTAAREISSKFCLSVCRSGAMESQSMFNWKLLLGLSSLLVLAGCGGSPSTSTTTTTTTTTPTYQLTVTAPASGIGTITSSPAGINCPTTCSGSFTQNTQVILTETT